MTRSSSDPAKKVKQLEQELSLLRVVELNYRTLMESMGDSLYVVDRDCRYIFMNREHLSRLGIGNEDIIGAQYADFHNQAQTRAFREMVETVIRSGKTIQSEHASARDGRFFLRTLSPVRKKGKTGAIIGVAVVSKDITERRRMEEKLRESHHLYRTLAENIFAGVYIVQDGTIRYVNRIFANYTGFGPELLIGGKFMDLVHSNDRDTVEEKIEEMLSGTRTSPCIFRIAAKDRRQKWIAVAATSIHYEGRPAVLGSAMDLTERIETEESLRDSQQQLGNIIDFLPDPTLVIDMEGKIIAWNRAMEKITGKKAEEMVGRGDYEYALPLHGERRPILADLIIRPDRENEKTYYPNLRREGDGLFSEVEMNRRQISTCYWVAASPLFNTKGVMAGAIESIRDITDTKRAKEALRVSEANYRNIFENAVEGIFQTSPEGRFISANPAMVRLLGYDSPGE
ncbi:MAG: PAS domain S-box protein, partial [Syntrophales bacterium]|nr:PAS domain S-box protein [Syntrophales bacterium]